MTENNTTEPTEENEIINYLDLEGVRNLKNELDARYVSKDAVNGIVDQAIANYKDAIVQIAESLESITEPQEGYLYLVPDPEATTSTIYKAYAWEHDDSSDDPTVYHWVQMGASQFSMTVDQELLENSSNPVANKAVYAKLQEKLDSNLVTNTVAANNLNPVTSAGVYAALQNKINKDDFKAITAAQITSIFEGGTGEEEEEEPGSGE